MGKKVVASHVTDVIFVCDISMVKYFTLLIGSLQVCFFFVFLFFFVVFFFIKPLSAVFIKLLFCRYIRAFVLVTLSA